MGSDNKGWQLTGNIPPFVSKAMEKVALDSLVSIGTARMDNVKKSRETAVKRAGSELKRKGTSIIEMIFADYAASFKDSNDIARLISLREKIIIGFNKFGLLSSVVVEEDTDANNAVWCVLIISKENLIKVLSKIASSRNESAAEFLTVKPEARDEANAKLFEKIFTAESINNSIAYLNAGKIWPVDEDDEDIE